MRVAIYARVSTEDKRQDPENQLRDLRAWCAGSGHDIVREHVDRVSGRKSTGERKRFAALPIGRPRASPEREKDIQRLLLGGTGINKAAATVGGGTATVQRVRAEMGPFESGAAA